MRRTTLLILGALLFMGAGLRAADPAAAPGFVQGLSDAEKAACGLSHLSESQVSAIDRDASRDIQLAHEGGVSAFARTFSLRHAEYTPALAGLSDQERAFLDARVAQAIAATPQPATFAQARRQAETAGPDVPARGLEVHGDFSVMVGGGRGGSFYGSSMDVRVSDPEGRFTLGVGAGVIRGRGIPFCAEASPLFPDGWLAP